MQDGAVPKELQGEQQLVKPSAQETSVETLTPEEEKILEHLKDLQGMGMTLPPHLEQQTDDLLAKQQLVSAAKSITHGHIKKLNKLKSQVSTAGRKVQQLDEE